MPAEAPQLEYIVAALLAKTLITVTRYYLLCYEVYLESTSDFL
jgi:hypothetical protein